MKSKQIENTYLNLLKYYQDLQRKLERIEFPSSVLFNLNELLENEEVKVVIKGIEVNEIRKRIKEDINYRNFSEYKNLLQQKEDLNIYLNAGNLRHVVSMLYKEEGLTVEEFSKKIGCTTQEVFDLTINGIIKNELLNNICQYFCISKTQEFTRYIKNYS